jgi:hypothetical protein
MKDSIAVICVCACLCGAFLRAAAGSSVAQDRPVVITQADEEAIKRILDNWREHQSKVSYSSMVEPYFDCEAHRQILEYGWKAVPHLVGQLARQEATEAYVGSALIDDPNVRTLQDVSQNNRLRKTRLYDETLASWILTGVLQELTSPEGLRKENAGGRSQVNDWLDWWRLREQRFVFASGGRPDIVVPREKRRLTPHIATSVKDGLLDICAVSATYRQILERAAAEVGIRTFIGEHRYIDVIGSVRMKSVTYQEFLYMVGRSIYINGFDYRKVEDGYSVGGRKPAEPRVLYSKGWAIVMDRTVFGVGEDIPVTIIARGTIPAVDPCDSAVVPGAGFRVTTNDGNLVLDYGPSVERFGAVAMLTDRADTDRVEILLNRFCSLDVGEYNIRFGYQDHETPTVPIEVYPRDSTAARQARLSRTCRPETENQ